MPWYAWLILVVAIGSIVGGLMMLRDTANKVELTDEQRKRVAERKRRRRKAPLPAIAAGDRIYLTDVPTPGEALSEPDAEGDLDVKLGSLRARINVRQIERGQHIHGRYQIVFPTGQTCFIPDQFAEVTNACPRDGVVRR